MLGQRTLFQAGSRGRAMPGQLGLLLIVAILATTLIVLQVHAVGPPTITLTPNIGPVGTSVTLGITGCPQCSGTATLTWDTPSTTLISSVTCAVSSNAGTFTVPATSPSGGHTVTLSACPGNGNSATASFVVTLYKVTFDAAPIVGASDVSSTTTVLTITVGGTGSTCSGGSATTVTKGGLPYTASSLSSGTDVCYSYSSPISTTSSTKQYRWGSISTATGSAFGQTGQSGSFLISANSTVTASYVAQYQVTFAVSPSGDGTTSPTGINVFEDSGSLSISATPNAGFVFLSWTSSTGSITFASASSASTTATISGSGTITGNFGVIQPFTVTMSNSAPSATVTVNTCLSSPSTFSSDGVAHSVTITPSCSFTLSFSNSGTSRNGFSNSGSFSATSTSQTSCSTGTCSGISLIAYDQLQNTYQATPRAQTTWDTGLSSQTVVGTQLAVAGQTGCSITLTSGGGAVSCQAFFDYQTTVTIGASTITGAPSNSQWLRSGTCSFTQTSGGNTDNCDYYKQWTNTFQAAANAQTTFDSGLSTTVTANSLGSSTAICAITPTGGQGTGSCSGYVDNSGTATFSTTMTGAPASSQWKCVTCTTASITSGAGTLNINYYKQWTNTFQATANAQSTFDSGLSASVTAKSLGSSSTICTISPTAGQATGTCSGFVDNGATPTFVTTMSGAPASSQWKCGTCTTSSITSGAGTLNINYYKQWSTTWQITASAQTTFDASMTLGITGTSLGVASTGLCTMTTAAAATASCVGFIDNNQGGTFAATLTGAPSSSRWQNAANGASTSAVVTSVPATRNVNYYKQWTNTFSAAANAQSTFDAGLNSIAVTGNQLGSSTTICTISPTSGDPSDTCSGYVDNANTPLVLTTIGGPPANSRWMCSTCNFGSITSGGTIRIVNYYKQWTNNWKYSVTSGSPTAPSLSCNQFGLTASITLTTSNQGFYCDNSATATATNPTSGSTGTHRWSDNSQSFTIASPGGANNVFAYYEQYALIYSYSVNGGGAPSAPILSCTEFGASFTPTLTTGATTYWCDNSQAWNVSPNPLSGSTSSERWFSSQTLTGTVSGASVTTVFTFYRQLQNTYDAHPSAPTTFSASITFTVTGTLTGSAGTVCTITVPASPTAQDYNCTNYADYNTAVSMPSSSGNNPNSNTRWQVSGTASFTDTTTGNTHTSNYYEQFQNTYQATPSSPATWDATFGIPVTGTVAGAIGQTGCTINTTNGGGTVSCQGWFDYNTLVTVTAPVTVSTSEQWLATSTNSFTETSAGATHTVTYRVQFKVTVTVSPSGAGNTNPFGTTGWLNFSTTLSISATTISPATWQSWTSNNPSITFASSTSQSTTATINGGGTITANFGVGLDCYAAANSAGAGTGTVSVTLTNCQANDIIIVLFTANNNGLTVTVTDTGGRTYTQRFSATTNNAQQVTEFYAIANTAITSTTITATVTGGNNIQSNIEAIGFSGIYTTSPFDGSPFTASGNNNVPSVSGISTSNPNDIIIALEGSQGNTLQSSGSGSYLIQSRAQVNEADASQYLPVSSTQTGLTISFSTSAAKWNMIVDALKRNLVTQPVTITTSNSGPSATITVTGSSCTPWPASITSDGNMVSMVATPSCALTFTVPSDGTNTRYRFNNAGSASTTWAVTACGTPSTCSAASNTAYYQLQNTFQITANAQSTFDSGLTNHAVTSTFLGASGSTICSITITSGVSSASCSGYSDTNAIATFPASIGTPPANSRWENAAGAASNTATITTGGGTFTTAYYKQWLKTFEAAAVGQSTFSNVLTLSITGTSLGSSAQTICTITTGIGDASDSCSGYVDNNGTATFAEQMSGSPANTRRENAAGTATTTSAITSGGAPTLTTSYYKQLFNTYAANPSAPTTFSPSITFVVTGTILGTTAQPVCTITVSATPSPGPVNCQAWADYNTAVNMPATSGNNPSSTQWAVSGTSSFTETNGGVTDTSNYYEQLQNTYQVAANAQSTFDNGLTFTLTGTLLGNTGQTICTISPASTDSLKSCIAYADYGTPVSFPANPTGAAPNTRWQLSGTSTFTDTTASNSHTANYYMQLTNTYQATPLAQTTWDSGLTPPGVVGIQLGSTGQTGCSITLTGGAGAANCSSYFDYNTAVTIGSSTINGAPANSRWLRNGTCTFTQTTGGNTNNCDFYKQFSETLSYSVIGGGTPTGPSLTSTSLDSSSVQSLTTIPTGYFFDSGASWSVTNPLGGSSSTERWATNQPTSGSFSSSSAQTLAFPYYHQFSETLSYSVTGGGSPTAPTFAANQFGSPLGQAMTTTPTDYWFDSGASWTITNPLGGSTATERWAISQASGTLSTISPETLVFTYYHQFRQTLSYSVIGGGTPTAPTFSAAQFGSLFDQILSATPIDYWFDSGTLWAVTNPIPGVPGERWKIDTDNQADNGTISSPQTIDFVYIYQYYLTVTSSQDTPTPTSNWFNAGSSITESVTSPVSGGTGIQHVTTGWTGTGSVPSSGTLNTITFTIAAASTITWNWQTQYLLRIETNGLPGAHTTNVYLGGIPSGTASDSSPFSQWFNSGASTETIGVDGIVNAGPGTLYLFSQWSDSSTNNPRASVTMNSPQTYTAQYATQTDTTTVTCVPSTVPAAHYTTCTATVVDTSSTGATTPSGNVTFSTSGTGSFNGSPCILAGLNATAASCQVTYTPTTVGNDTITAQYNGDSTHPSSSSTTTVIVSEPLAVTVTCPTSGLTAGKPFNCTVTASGGTQPYTGTGNFTRTEPVKGTLTESFSVTDADNFTSTGSANVTIAAQPIIVTVTCPTSGVTAGKPFDCTVGATGGTAPYSGTGTISRTESTKGMKTETFTVIDSNQISAQGSATVDVSAQPIVVTATCPTSGVTAGKPFDCTVSATGGTTPYTGTGTISRTEPAKGTKTETFNITDSNQVSAIGSTTVNVEAQLIVVTVTCPTSGVTAGKPFDCTVSAIGGTAPYSGTGTLSRTEATKGPKTETFTVTDSNQASAQGSATIIVAAQPLVVTVACPTPGITAGKPFTCTVSATGGTGPYSGIDNFTRTQPVKGTFTETFTVTDSNGQSASGSTSITVSPQPLLITASCSSNNTAGKPVNCSASATGGTTPYRFTWDVGKNATVDGEGSTFTTSFPVKGTYSIDAIVTDFNNATASVNLAISISPQPLVVTIDCGSNQTAGKPFTCNVSASGGTSPYNGTGSFQRTEAVKGIHVETFNVTDANTDSASGSATVTVIPQPLVITASCQPGTAGKPTTCNASASGGTTPYTFYWDEGKNGTPDGQGPIFTTIFAVKGTYSVDASVVDANNATAFVNLPIVVRPQSLSVTASCQPGTVGKPTNCDASASGGTEPYTFHWDVGKNGTIDGQGSTFTTVFGVKGGYSIDATVTDANGATAFVNIAITVLPQPLVVTVSCPTSGVTAGKPFDCGVSATGGTSPYSGTGNLTITEPVKGTFTETFNVTDTNGVTSAGSASVTIAPQPLTVNVTCPSSGVTAGKPFNCTVSATGGTGPYTGTGTISRTEPTKGTKTETFTVTDSNGASGSDSETVFVAPQPLIVSVTCDSGATAGKPFNCSVSAIGGTAPYTGTGSLSVTEPVKGTFAENFNVTDTNGITASGSAIVIIAAQPLTVSVTCQTSGVTAGKPFNCTVSATGGTGPYSGTGTFSRTEATKGTKTETFSVTDDNSVTATGSGTVSVAPQPLDVTVACPTSGVTAGKPFNCTVSATGGTEPYDGTGSFSRTVATKGTKTETFTVTDSNSVSASGSTTVNVTPQPLVVIVVCYDGTAGKPIDCDVSATGGTTAYNGTGSFSRTFATKGTYNVCFDVTDSNNVTATGCDSATIASQPLVVTVVCSDGTSGKPVTCDVSATGGSTAYNSTGSFTRSFPVKGSYNVCFDVTDSNQVTATGCDSVLISPQPLVVTVACSDGTAGKPVNCDVSATGGTESYNGTGRFTPSFPVKGTYDACFDVTDANGATARGCDSVRIDPQPLVITAVCTDGSVGKPIQCDASATGGTAPYTILWDLGKNGTIDGQGSNFTAVFPTKGTYSIDATVTDFNNATDSVNLRLVVGPQPLVAAVDCGSVQTAGKPFTCTVSATGGTEPYTGTGSLSIIEPVKGPVTETFNVTDANGARSTASASITVAPQLLVVIATCSTSGLTAGKPFVCTVSATGGTSPYSGTGNFTVTEPAKGTFTERFSVTDSNNATATGSAVVNIAPQPLVVVASCANNPTSGKPVTCSATVTGGTSPYTITWDVGKDGTADGSGSNFTTTFSVKGTYSIDVNATDANGATAFVNLPIIIAPQPLEIIASCQPGTAGKPTNCQASASGGTEPYAFSWDADKDGTVDGSGSNFTTTFTLKGTYSIDAIVRDGNGRTTSINLTILVNPQPLVITGSCQPGTAGKPTNCIASAIGGTEPYTFTWDVGKNGTIEGTGQSFNTVFPTKGTYSIDVVVTDANRATAFVNLPVVVQPQPLLITASCQPGTAGKPTNCDASASGGTEPYTFLWDLRKDGSIDGQGFSFTTAITTKGNYSIDAIVSDANGATTSLNLSVSVAPQPLTITASCQLATVGKPTSCTASATGGTAPYSFSWDIAKNGTVDGVGPSFTTSFAAKGTYSIDATVRDANGATAFVNLSVTVAPQALVVNVSCPTSGPTAAKPFVCTVSASGGTGPYNGTGNFTVTESAKGTFTEAFDVTDANGVTASGSTGVTIAPQPLVITASCSNSNTAGKPVSCNASATGGTAPYAFTWDVGKNGSIEGQGASFNTVFPVKGTYFIDAIVTDGNGVTAFVNLPVVVGPQPLVAAVSCPTTGLTAGKPFNCSVSAIGGTSPYSGTGTFSITEPVKGGFSETFTVTDANGVSASASASVNVGPQPLVVTVTCPATGLTAGKSFTCIVSATGGTAPYTGADAFTVTEPAKGTFTETFSVTDANGGTASGSTTVTIAPQPLVVTVACPTTGLTAGKPFNCTVSATGGTSPYTATGQVSRTEAVKGTYTETFTVTDANQNTASASTSVTISAQPLIVTVACPASGVTAGKPFDCTVSATGGTQPYTGTGTISRTEATKGTRTETFNVTDNNGVTANGSATIIVTAQPLVVSVSCPTSGVTAGKPFDCTVSATGGTQPYTGTGTISRTEATKGTNTETFSVTDSNGATSSGSATVSVAAQPIVVTVTCPTSGVTAGKPFDCGVSATGGTTPYTGTGTISRTEVTKGTKTETFTVTDNNGATASASTTVNVAAQPLVVTVSCPTSGVSVGKPFDCAVSATGGTAPYSGTGTFSRTEATKGTRTETFIVTDSNGATASGSASVSVAAQPLVVTVSCPTSGVTAGKPFDCTVSASGGTAPYTGTGTISRTEAIKGSKTENFTVTDSNGVSATGPASVTVAAQPLVVTVSCPASGVTSGKPFNCNVTATGGTVPYTGTGNFSRTEATKGTRTETFTVTDSNSISGSGSATVSVAPQPLVVTVVCSDGTAGKPVNCDVSATGGTTAYTGTGSFSRTFATKGTYNVCFDVTDANGITATGCDTVIIAPQPLVVTVDCGTGQTAGKPFNCTVSATGGTEPYTGTGTFSKTEATKGTKTETFSVTDSNGVTASGSASVSVVAQALAVTATCPTSGITAGKPFTCTVSATGGTSPYTGTGAISRTEVTKGTKTETFTVTDANGASASGSTTVTVAAQTLVVTVSCPTSGVTAGKPFDCTVTATGGTAPYVGTGTLSIAETTKGTKTETFNVTDNNGIIATGSTTVTVAPQQLVVSVSCPSSGVTAGKPFNCTVSATGGSTPYTGTGTVSRTEATKGTRAETFTVTDSNGVSATGTASVTVEAQPLLPTVTCPSSGLTAGKPFDCTVSATGGTAPYTGTGTFSRTEATKGTKTETFSVTDNNGVAASASATVSIAPQPLVITVTCPTSGVTAGKPFDCTVSATGGTQPYSGTGTFTRTEATKGTKTENFSVTDNNGVTASGSSTVSVAPQALSVTVTCPTSGITVGKPFDCTISATGGTQPYTGTGTVSRTEASKGIRTETFNVADSNGVTATGSTTVTVSAQPLVVTVTCPSSGLTAGKPFNCTVSATGGTAPYTGTGTISATEPAKGTRTKTFSVTDSNGVSASGSATVTVTAQPMVADFTFSPASPLVGQTVTFTATISGGTSGYTFNWTFGDSSTGTGSPATHAYTAKGSYTVVLIVTDANSATTTVTHSIPVSATQLTVTASCPTSGITAGKPFNCTVSASGGTGPYTGTGTTSRTEPLKGSATETFTVTDSNGASASGSATVNVGSQPLLVTVNCGPGQTAGKPFSCDVSASGGTQPYSGTGSVSVTEPVKGTFIETFTVTDTNGLTASGSASVTIDPQLLVVTVVCPNSGLTAGKPFNCDVSATGGTAPYSGTGSFSITDPVKGTYTETFSVTDANGVTRSSSVTVIVAPQPLAVTVTCPASGLTAGKPFTCTVSAAGGTGPYSGTGTQSVTEPVKGTFTESFSVSDSNGVTGSGSATVAVAAQPLTVAVTCPLSGVTSGKPFNCTVSASGGTAPYTGTGTFSRSEQTKGTKTETFTVADSNGVSASGSVTVSVSPQPLVVTVTCDSGATAGKPFNCNVSTTGGTIPYTGTGTFSVTEPVKGTLTETFRVTDANGVAASGSASVTVAPQPLLVTANCPSSGLTVGKPFTCTVSANGGTAPYSGTGSFSVTEPAKGTFTERFTVTDANGASASGTASVTIGGQPLVVTATCPGSGLTAGKPFNCNVSATGGTSPYTGTGTVSKTEPVKGTYTESFTVMDSNGVSASATTTVTVSAQPLVVTVSCPTSGLTAGKPFDCTIIATGGTPPYTRAGTISRTEPTKGSKTETFSVTDSNGVTSSASATVSIASQPLIADFTFSPPSPAAGQTTTFTATVAGGSSPYTFSWSFGDTSTGSGNPVTHSYASKGSYTVVLTVTDANSATATATHAAAVSGTPLSGGDFTFSPTNPTAAKLVSFSPTTVSGGTPPYTLSWNFGDGQTGTGSTVSHTYSTKNSYTVTLTVTDANGASMVTSHTLPVTGQPMVITVSCPASGITAGKPFNCTVSASGGTGPYTGTGTFSVTETVKGSRTETFTVTDANIVSASASATVTVAAQPLVVTVACPTSGVTVGKPFSCTVSANGGTQPYTGTGSFSVTETTKGSRTESFTVTDANGGSATGSATVSVSGQPLVVTVSCPSFGATASKPFNCTVSATGGTSPYAGTGTVPVTESTKGTKTETFTVTDANGVSASGSATVIVAAQPLVVSVSCSTSGVTAGKPFNCTVSATGGTAPYTGTGTFSRTENVKGTRTETFTVTDANSITASGSATVLVAAQPLTASFGVSGTLLAGSPITFTGTMTGGTTPYGFTWSFGDNSAAGTTNPVTHTYVAVGTYTVTLNVTDANNISTASSQNVNVVTSHSTGTVVACSPSAIVINQTTTCTATVTDTSSGAFISPTGSVSFSRTGAAGTFSVTSCTLGSSTTASASCSVSFKSTAAGNSTITGSYGGDTSHNISSGTTTVRSNLRATVTKLVCSPSTIVPNQNTNCTATVMDTSPGVPRAPTGTVAFTSSGTGGSFTRSPCTLATLNATSSSCKALYTRKSGTGSQTITGAYGGDTTHAASSGTTTVTTTNPPPIAVGTIIFLAAVGGVGAAAVGVYWYMKHRKGTGGSPPGSTTEEEPPEPPVEPTVQEQREQPQVVGDEDSGAVWNYEDQSRERVLKRDDDSEDYWY